MKKWMIWVAAGLALCLLVVGFFVVSWLNRNPNVGLCLADADEGQPLVVSLEEASLVVHRGELTTEKVTELSQSCMVIVAELTAPRQAKEITEASNVPVVFVGCQPEGTDACYIGGDAKQAGEVFGQLLLSRPERGDWNEDGTVTCLLLGADPVRADMLAWSEGIRQQLRSAGLQAEFVAMPGTAYTRQTGKAICEQVLSAYGKDLEAVLVCSDSALKGAMEALQAGGRVPGWNVTLLGAGHSSQMAELVQAGQLCGYAYMDEESYIQAVVAAANAARDGKKPESKILEYVPVTAK